MDTIRRDGCSALIHVIVESLSSRSANRLGGDIESINPDPVVSWKMSLNLSGFCISNGGDGLEPDLPYNSLNCKILGIDTEK